MTTLTKNLTHNSQFIAFNDIMRESVAELIELIEFGANFADNAKAELLAEQITSFVSRHVDRTTASSALMRALLKTTEIIEG